MAGREQWAETGGAPDDLKAGGEIQNTQGSVDLFSLVGSYLRPPVPAGADSSAPGATAAASAAAPAQ